MSWITNVFKGVGRLFTSPDARKKAEAALNKGAQIAAQLYPLVEAIAIATPNRTDDEIIRVVNSYGLMGIVDASRPDRAGVLRDIALNVASKTVAKDVPGSLISLGIETAVQVYKANHAQPKAE